jgi:hypothetical protein
MFSDAGVLKKMNIGKVFIFLSIWRTKKMDINQLSMSTRNGLPQKRQSSFNAAEKKACHEKWVMVQSLDVSNPEKVLSLLLQK